MLIAAFILVISTAALMQFAIFAWRASLLRTVSEQVANQADASPLLHSKLLSSNNFREVVAIYRDICPELDSGSSPNLRAVSVYYAVMGLLSRIGSVIMAAESLSWAHREMALCTQYATVCLSQRLERNLNAVNQARSF